MMTTPFMTSAVCQSFEVLPQLSLAIFSVQSDVYRKKGGTWNREMDEKIKNKTLALRDTGVMNIFDTRKVKCLTENFKFDGLV